MSNKGQELYNAAIDGEVDKVRGLLAGMTPSEVNWKNGVSEWVLHAIIRLWDMLSMMLSHTDIIAITIILVNIIISI